MIAHPVHSAARAVFLTVGLALFAGLALAAPADSADVGMVTQVGGKAHYADALDAKASNPVVAFMKIREGDRISLAQGASLRLVFFAGAKQESWQGPAVLSVGKDGASVEGAIAPRVEVAKLPVQVAEVMQTAPMAASRDNISKGGFVNVRAPKVKPLPVDDEARVKIETARLTYAALRAQAGADDVYPEWYLAGVYAKYGLYDDMASLVDGRLRERPKNAALKQLRERVAALAKAE